MEALVKAVSGAHRRSEPYLLADQRSQFRRRLKQAAKGQLHPVEHIKTIRRQVPGLHLFEIRWSDVRVAVIDRVSGLDQGFEDVQVRLYHVEPECSDLWFAGLHAHEKVTTGDDESVAKWQDDEIDFAANIAEREAERHWDVVELQQ